MPASASLTDSLSSFFDAVGQFFSNLAAVHWGALVVALACFGLNLTLRSRAIFNTLRAAYPARVFEWRRIWGAYFAAVGFNNVVPIRGGDVIKLYLTKTSIPDSSYPATAAAFFTEAIFDSCIGVLVLIYAFTQGVFPKPPDFSKLNAFDLSYFAGHPRFTLFLLTGAGVLALVAFAVLSRRVRAFWARVRQGFTILSDRRRYLRQVAALQLAGWLCRFAAFWFLLDAFRVGGSVHNTLLVFGVNAVAGAVPFTPAAPACSRPCWSRSSPGPRRAPPSPPTRWASRSRSPRSRSRSASRPCSRSSASARSRRSSTPAGRPARLRPRRRHASPGRRAARG